MERRTLKQEVIYMIRLRNLSNILDSFKYTNQTINGNFVDNSDWVLTGATGSVVNNTYTVNGNGTSASPRIQQTTSLAYANNKVIYVTAKMKVTNADCASLMIAVYATGMATKTVSIATPTNGTEYTVSGVITCTAGGSGNLGMQTQHNYVDAGTANGKTMTVREVMMIDLTSLFGAGNEPSKADCDNIFRFTASTTQPNFSKTILT